MILFLMWLKSLINHPYANGLKDLFFSEIGCGLLLSVSPKPWIPVLRDIPARWCPPVKCLLVKPIRHKVFVESNISTINSIISIYIVTSCTPT